MEARTMKSRTAVPALALALGALAVAGCGSSDDKGDSGGSGGGGGYSSGSSSKPKPSGAAAGTVKLSADPTGKLAFTSTQYTAKAGKVTLDMKNPTGSGVGHGVAVEGQGVDKDGPVVDPGKSSTVTATLKPGKYEFYCPVPAHKAAGMKGTLTVK
jgi:uncharacterized cupredoxin-like copper-binding protein